tara:strand:+ start:1350 stop:1544 length:195 start_codon:yes stop_codon:yes gene_type:complete
MPSSYLSDVNENSFTSSESIDDGNGGKEVSTVTVTNNGNKLTFRYVEDNYSSIFSRTNRNDPCD